MESESYDDVMSGRALMRNLDKMNAPKGRQAPLGCPYCANELEVQFMDDAPRRLYLACYCHQCLASVCIEKAKAYELLPPNFPAPPSADDRLSQLVSGALRQERLDAFAAPAEPMTKSEVRAITDKTDGKIVLPLRGGPTANDDYTELPRKSPDAPRRFRIDCPVCQGAGAECFACRGSGFKIAEVDEDEIDP